MGAVIAGATYFNVSQDFIANETQTLSPIGSGITSYEVNTYNNIWINCSNNNSLTVDISDPKTTISVWFTNSTTDWTSIIKSDNDIYIDGNLDTDWEFLPYFISGNIITFCKTDGSTFINASIDAIRVYNRTLESTEVLEVYNYGR